EVVHADHVPLHAGALRDLDDLASPAQQAGHLNDDLKGRGNLTTDDPDGQVEAGHADHHLEARQRVARVVGVDGGHAALVAGVHGLEHVQRLRSAALADDDAVGPHTQGVAD